MILSAGHAGVAKLAYAQDLKSCGSKEPYGFDPRLLHHDLEQTGLRGLPIGRRCTFRLTGLCSRPTLCMALAQYLGSDEEVIEVDRFVGRNWLTRLNIPLQPCAFVPVHMNDFNGDPMILNLPDLSQTNVNAGAVIIQPQTNLDKIAGCQLVRGSNL